MFVEHDFHQPSLSVRDGHTNAIAQTVRCNDEEQPVGLVAMFLQLEVRFQVESARQQFRVRGIDIIDFEEAALLRRIAAVFCQTNLHIVPSKNSATDGRIGLRNDMETHLRFVKRNGPLDIGHRQVHRIVGVRSGSQESGFHGVLAFYHPYQPTRRHSWSRSRPMIN